MSTSWRPFPRTADRLLLVSGIVVLTIVVDQVSKWWAWRHVDGTGLNPGGHFLLGSPVRDWFAEPRPGAIANAVGAVAVVVALVVVVHRGRRQSTLLGVGLLAAGWASNLLDRLGLHHWTAPGSGRGVVDFIPTGMGYRGNLADLLIATGTAVVGWTVLTSRFGLAGTAARP